MSSDTSAPVPCYRYTVEIFHDSINPWNKSIIVEYYIPRYSLCVNCSKNNFGLREWHAFEKSAPRSTETREATLPHHLVEELYGLWILHRDRIADKEIMKLFGYHDIDNSNDEDRRNC